MISEKMKPLVNNNSAIRAMFEEGNNLKKQYGEENVFDFSLGNPNVPAPEAVKKAIIDILNEEESTKVHGYMNNAGYEDVRTKIASSINNKYATKFTYKNIIMTVGAASGLNILLKTILNPGDEVITFAPYFVEYGNYVKNFDGELVVIPPECESFSLDLKTLEEKITPKTKAVILNNPNNPTGVIYGEGEIKALAAVLKAKEEELGSVIYLISDEPYRELAYDDIEVTYLTKFYDDTLVGYSYSKSLSLPGERIGYVVIPDEIDGSEEFIAAATIANRVTGSVNAPSLMQRVIGRCLDEKTDIEYYDRNRKTLYNGLTSLGFQCVKPEGAFYLWMKSPIDDEKEFVKKGKKYNILMVPGSSFACPGYVRIAYCVSHETIINSLPKFKELAEECF